MSPCKPPNHYILEVKFHWTLINSTGLALYPEYDLGAKGFIQPDTSSKQPCGMRGDFTSLYYGTGGTIRRRHCASLKIPRERKYTKLQNI